MTAGTLLEVVSQRFGVDVDRDSNGGRILAALMPEPEFPADARTGIGDGSLAVALTAAGVVPAPPASVDTLVFSCPARSTSA